MRSFKHRRIIEQLVKISSKPEHDADFDHWITAQEQIAFLKKNAVEDELAVYAAGPHTYFTSVLIPRQSLDSSIDVDELLEWHIGGGEFRSAFVTSGGETRLENNAAADGGALLNESQHLIFWRTFEGWKGRGSRYPELLQEFSHTAGIHWREEYEAYVKFDDAGDIDPVFSVSQHGQEFDALTLATVQRQVLDDFLATGDFVLLRLFDFTLLKYNDFSSYGDGPETYGGNGGVRFRQKVNPGHASYTRGFQIVRPQEGYEQIRQTISDRWFGNSRDYVTFTIKDWRNDKIVDVSTDPKATTNYFDAKENNLPYELSPAFFKPDVLLKYQGDSEKYTVETRRITCRSAWALKSYDVNEAGQVHAYICDLRRLPYKEQLYWLSHNEEPKAPISERAFKTDFLGQFHDRIDPLDALKISLRRYNELRVAWWKLGTQELLDQAFTPRTSSKDEWAEACMRLAKLVNEGLVAKTIKLRLSEKKIDFEKNEGSLKLFERLWTELAGEQKALAGMREVQAVRSKIRGHRPTTEGENLARKALCDHGSYRAHFEEICQTLTSELAIIDHFLAPEN